MTFRYQPQPVRAPDLDGTGGGADPSAMSHHTPPPDGPVPPGDPHHGTPKTPPPRPTPGNPYADSPPYQQPGDPYANQPPYPQQPGHPVAQPPLSPADERTWALISHLSFFVLSVFGPLIVMLVFGSRSEYVRRQSVEALNFHLTVAIALVASLPLMFLFIGFLTFAAALVYGMVMSVIAAVRLSDGADYHYPVTLRMIT